MEPARLRAMLARTPGLTAGHLFACLSRDPGCDALPPDLPQRLLRLSLPPRTRAWLEHPDEGRIDADLRWMEASACRILIGSDPDYPRGLARSPAAPAALYLWGNRQSLSGPALAVVGLREPTAAGLDTARRFAQALARAGVTIVGGLAEGIATAAHEGALAAQGRPVGVCAAGLDRVQAAGRGALAERIRAQGCLLSAFAPGAAPRPYHFVVRNRLIGALGAGTLVIEAAAGNTALLTAYRSGLLGKQVFAIPGSIRDPQARGCNQLIRAGATLVQEPEEILRELGIDIVNHGVTDLPSRAPQPAAGPSPLDNKYEMLLDAAGFEPVDIDVLAFRTGWSGHDVAAMLLLLELQGRIAPQPGGRYCRLS